MLGQVHLSTSKAVDRLDRERVALLYRRSGVALATVVINGLLLGALMASRIPPWMLAVWGTSVLSVTAARALLARAYWSRPDPSNARTWERWFAVGAGANGVAWGIGGYAFVGADLVAAVGTVFVVGGMVAGASSSNATSRMSFAAYSLPAIVPLVTRLLVEGETIHLVLAGMLALFGVAMAALANQGGTALLTAMELRFRNADLAEEVERRSRERSVRLRLLLDQAGVVVIVADPKTLEIVDASENAGAMLDLGTESFSDKVLTDLGSIVSIRSEAEWKAVFARAEVSGEQTLSGVTSPDERLANVELSVTVRRIGARSFALLVLKDVTQRRELERHLAQMGVLSSLGSVAAGLAHEVNNPLAYMMLNLHNLKEHLTYDEEGIDDRLTQAVNDTIAGAERIQRIVRDLGQTTRPQAGAGESSDLAEVVATCLQVADSEIVPRAQVKLELADVPRVRADPLRLTQAVLNLLLNAAQSVAVGDRTSHEITVRARHRREEKLVEFSISDTGRGFPHDPERLFDPFESPPLGRSDTGLSACHAIIASLDGTLAFESRPGIANTVTVRVPAYRS